MNETRDSRLEKRMTLGEHLEELRRRVIYALGGLLVGIVVAALFGQRLLDALKLSYVRAMSELNLTGELAVPAVTAGFTTYFYIALVAGVLIASPWIFYQLWMFISAGLYPHERRYVLYSVPFSAMLFLAGAMFFLFVASFPLMRFFVGFNRWLGVRPVIMLRDHISFMTRLMLVFGLAFETPLAVLVLAKAGLVTAKTLSRYRRHVIVCILVFAAVVTSPSPVDQVALALPMYLLFELGVLLAYVFASDKKADRQA